MRKIEKAIATARALASWRGHRLRPFRRFGVADASLVTSCKRCTAEAEVCLNKNKSPRWKLTGSALKRRCLPGTRPRTNHTLKERKNGAD